MNVISLFSGIGGFDLGLERAGHTIVGQVEIDTACRRVLGRRFPREPASGSGGATDGGTHQRGRQAGAGLPDDRPIIHEDITTYHPARGSADLVCGGFPCQDLSVAGRRAGLAGERSGLWFEFRRVIDEVAPSWVLIENVPGLLSSNDGRDMAVVLRGLEELGYGWAYRVLDARYFGVAQRRRRVFIVGYAGNAAGAAEVLFEREGSEGDLEARSQTRARVAGGSVASTLNSGGNDGGFQTEPGEHLVMSPAFSKRPGQQIATRDDAVRMGLVRRLTPTECERLQGFPDGWTAGESDSARYRMLGNAVCVPVAEWIGTRVGD